MTAKNSHPTSFLHEAKEAHDPSWDCWGSEAIFSVLHELSSLGSGLIIDYDT